MVRTKAGLHHQTAGALATSEAEQALADSWQKLIMLRLKSQKLQLRQQANPMSQTDMERVEASNPTHAGHAHAGHAHIARAQATHHAFAPHPPPAPMRALLVGRSSSRSLRLVRVPVCALFFVARCSLLVVARCSGSRS